MSRQDTQKPEELRVLAITRKPDSPSFEQRVLRFIEPLGKRGVEVQWRELPGGGREQRQLQRQAREFDLIWWHRHLNPPTRTGRWRRAARRLVYDFDDPVFFSTHPGRIRGRISRRLKFALWLRRCDAALPANEYLAQWARRYCRQVHVVPMAIDIGPPPSRQNRADGPAELLWMGSRSTTKFLKGVLPSLEKLAEARGDWRLRLVGHERLNSTAVDVDFRQWSPQQQQAALRECDIGLCPMPDNPWTRGKCPFKVLEYMAAGLPWVGSAVGELVTYAGKGDEARGLVAADDEQWVSGLSKLLDDGALRSRMGKLGRSYVEHNHAREPLADKLAELFRSIAAQG
ncbi:MAG: glycosyltransferase family 4 protein [Phycisphaerae bacterium]